MGIAVDGCAKGIVVVTRVAEHLAVAQILGGEQLTIAVGESIVVGVDVELTLLDTEQFAFLTNAGVTECSKIESPLLVEEGGLLEQLAIGRTCHFSSKRTEVILLYRHRSGIDHCYVEYFLFSSLTARAFLVIVEVEQLAVAFTIGHDATASKRLPAFGHIDA